jgi:hypothetical protein
MMRDWGCWNQGNLKLQGGSCGGGAGTWPDLRRTTSRD